MIGVVVEAILLLHSIADSRVDCRYTTDALNTTTDNSDSTIVVEIQEIRCYDELRTMSTHVRQSFYRTSLSVRRWLI